MTLIELITVKNFRSITDTENELRDLTSFNVIAGLNNSGKSNLLRALNLFFNNSVGLNEGFDFVRDINKQKLRGSSRNKYIEVGVVFSLPANFSFRSELRSVKDLLGENFKITKRWTKDKRLPNYYLNNATLEMADAEVEKVEQFINLINYRYIPNRINPIDYIKELHQPLRDVLIRRLGKKRKEFEPIFNQMQETSQRLILDLSERVNKVTGEKNRIKLKTPESWADVAFALGYVLGNDKFDVDDYVQGSGVQSLLMLETLYLIDKDYFQKFGWKQAAVWAIEEPESSLHTSMEVQVAEFLSRISQDTKSRLQIFATTHSDIMLQYGNREIFVTKESSNTRYDGSLNKLDCLKKSSIAGISRYSHPILFYPAKTVILVDGKYDIPFVKKILNFLDLKDIEVAYLEFFDDERTGGADNLGYLKSNLTVLKNRFEKAPLIMLLDWDERGVEKYEKIAQKSDRRLKILQWDKNKANPNLTTKFRGIERFYSDVLIQKAADNVPDAIFTNTAGKITVDDDQREAVKKYLYDYVSAHGFREEDLSFGLDIGKEIKLFLESLK